MTKNVKDNTITQSFMVYYDLYGQMVYIEETKPEADKTAAHNICSKAA
ncbi:MAG: hypothetical protein H0Z40_08445 [Desulfotomaculum sp.]|nr:hypothetical protein [Desulfotomaculum sp.]